MTPPAATGTTGKRSRTAAERDGVATTTAKPRTRKRPATTRAKRPAAPPPPPPSRRTGFLLVGALVALAAVAVAVAAVRTDGGSVPADGVSANELAELAAEREPPVYWLGTLDGRELELTTTGDGTFVRYLPAGVEAGADELALTVATYPVANAYATAQGRARADGMVSRETRNGGLAVWSEERPTSVYVAFAGVPQLVEVYAPDAAEARELALSGRLRPVR